MQAVEQRAGTGPAGPGRTGNLTGAWRARARALRQGALACLMSKLFPNFKHIPITFYDRPPLAALRSRSRARSHTSLSARFHARNFGPLPKNKKIANMPSVGCGAHGLACAAVRSLENCFCLAWGFLCVRVFVSAGWCVCTRTRSLRIDDFESICVPPAHTSPCTSTHTRRGM